MNKQDFPIFQNNPSLIYLDNAATTQKPRHVINTISHFYNTQNANIHRGIYNLSEQSTKIYEQARAKIAQFINAQSSEIIFTSGTTASINMLARSLGKTLSEGDEIVLTEMEHHSNLIPWQQLAKRKRLILKYIPITDNYQLNLEIANNLITEKTKIVSVSHTSNVLGTINNISSLTKLAHNKGAKIIIDAAQSISHIPLDIKKIDCDFLVFSGHKVYGPTGIGVLYGKHNLLQELQPSTYGGGMVQEITEENATWNDIPAKFEAGTPPIAQAQGLAAAIHYLQSIGIENIQRQEQQLANYAREKLSQSGIKTLGDQGTVISFNINNIHPHDVAEILNRKNIAVRAGHHCAKPLHTKLNLQSTVRISLALYNTKKDIDASIQCLNQVTEVLA